LNYNAAKPQQKVTPEEKLMRSTKQTLLASALAAGLALAYGSASAQFNQFYFLGDSLTDAGVYGSRFTVNPGLVWAQDLGVRYGLAVTPSTQGGVDFAQGGARVTQPSPLIPAGAPQRSLSVQVDELLHATPTLNGDAVYTVWIGANDILVNVSAAGAGLLTAAQVQANVTAAATDTLTQIARLRDAGAKRIMVFNLPDIGKTPLGTSTPTAPFSALSGLFNSTLQAGLASLNVDIIPINVFGLFNEIIANPASFGLTNVKSPACTTSSSLNCTLATLVAPNADKTFAFADVVHPTPAGHQIIADYVAAIIEAPQKIGLLAEAPLQVEQANFRAIDARMWSGLNTPRPQNKYDAYAVYDYGNFDHDAGGGDNRLNSIVAGIDMKISDQMLAGVAFGYTEDKGSFGNGGGGFKLNEASITGYMGYGSGPWYVGASLGVGDLDFRNIRRSFALGAGTRTESGDTRGNHMMGRVFGGYWFNASQAWIHGPFARLTYQDAKVYAWSESGTSSSAMSFGHQKRDAFMSSLGWQVSGNIGSLRPFGRVTWEKDYNNDDREVRAGLVSMPGTFAIPAFKVDDSYFLFNVGASADLGNKLVGFISVSASASKDDGNYQAVTVGVRLPL
jgi:outer membrane lipase/esterase